eukprot:gene15853-17839_t
MAVKVEDIHHHSLITACRERLIWWNNEISSQFRCEICWLRSYDCYCKTLKGLSDKYDELLVPLLESLNFRLEILIYYHNGEIGRSANTAHIFKGSFQNFTTSVVYGKVEEDQEFWDKIVSESSSESSNPVYTCVLYPGKDSLPLSQWYEDLVQESVESSSQPTEGQAVAAPQKSVRIVVLDGTYACASRIARYLEVARERFLPTNESRKFFQFVCLELGSTENQQYCRSAMAGIMYQPAKEKICSYQATAIAIKDILMLRERTVTSLSAASHHNETQLQISIMKIFHEFINDLHGWVAYLIKKKIKFGKINNSRKSISDVDNMPADYVMEIIKTMPSQMYPAPKTVNSRRSQLRKAKEDRILGKITVSSFPRWEKRSDILLFPTRKFYVYSL